jgi:hypothetical protein
MADLSKGLVVALVTWSLAYVLCWWVSRGIKTWDQAQKECDRRNKANLEEWEKLSEEEKRDPRRLPLKWEVRE